MTKYTTWFLLSFFLVLAFGASQKSSLQSTVLNTKNPIMSPIDSKVNQDEFYEVVKVIDGDTFDISVKGKNKRVRLIGIDTPEFVDLRKPVQCYGREASSFAKNLLVNKAVRIENDITQGDVDKYQRLLRYVFLKDGTFVNKVMISEGYAHEYTYNSNPYKYQKEFIQAEREARNTKKGLWAEKTCE